MIDVKLNEEEFVFVNTRLYRVIDAPQPNIDGTIQLVKTITRWHKKTIKEDIGKDAERFILNIKSYKTIHQVPQEIQALLNRNEKLNKQGYLD